MSSQSELARRARKALRAVGCEGKSGYDTYAHAHEIASKSRRRRRGVRRIHAYRCGHCQKYHIGNDVLRPRRWREIE